MNCFRSEFRAFQYDYLYIGAFCRQFDAKKGRQKYLFKLCLVVSYLANKLVICLAESFLQLCQLIHLFVQPFCMGRKLLSQTCFQSPAQKLVHMYRMIPVVESKPHHIVIQNAHLPSMHKPSALWDNSDDTWAKFDDRCLFRFNWRRGLYAGNWLQTSLYVNFAKDPSAWVLQLDHHMRAKVCVFFKIFTLCRMNICTSHLYSSYSCISTSLMEYWCIKARQ